HVEVFPAVRGRRREAPPAVDEGDPPPVGGQAVAGGPERAGGLPQPPGRAGQAVRDAVVPRDEVPRRPVHAPPPGRASPPPRRAAGETRGAGLAHQSNRHRRLKWGNRPAEFLPPRRPAFLLATATGPG